jgi:2-dehydropantoate 2-reductase
MRVAIIGAGAVGMGLASCLLRSGNPVHFLARSAAAGEPLQRYGLERTGVFGSARFGPGSFEVSSAPEQLARWAPDLVLVCTKATASEEVADTLAGVWKLFERPPLLVLCQNGWGNAERFAKRLPRDRIFNARVITGFRRSEPWRVEITVHAEAIRIGSLQRRNPSAILALCDAIDAGGLPCEPADEIEKDLLAKLLYNCALNPLAALRGVPYGGVVDTEESRAICDAVVREIFEVLAKAGLATHWDSADAYLELFHTQLLPATRQHESSMLQDLRAGRRSEIDALCGAVVELAAAAGIEAPVNAALATLIRAIDDPERPATLDRPGDLG